MRLGSMRHSDFTPKMGFPTGRSVEFKAMMFLKEILHV
jgi:hypothetical protein